MLDVTEKDPEFFIKNMLKDILTMGELRKLAKNKGLSIVSQKKEELAEKICEKFLSPHNFLKFYEELPEGYKYLLHYLKINKVTIGIKDAMRYYSSWDIFKKPGIIFYRVNRDFFNKIKNDLAVKGLIVLIERKNYNYDESKYERFTLYLPDKLADLLPPLSFKGEEIKEDGEIKSFENFVKDLFFTFLRFKQSKEFLINIMVMKYLKINRGELYFGDRPVHKPFDFLESIYFAWLGESDKDIIRGVNIVYILQCIQGKQWLNIKDITRNFWLLTRYQFLKKMEIFIPELCNELFKMGFIEKTVKNSEIYYRHNWDILKYLGRDSEIPFTAEGIEIEKTGSLWINPAKVQIVTLLELFLISDVTYDGKKIHCEPSILKIGSHFRNFSGFANLKSYEYLRKNSRKYSSAFEYVPKNFGKFIVHNDISIFEIKDITISKLLEHNFPETFHPIKGDFFGVARKDKLEIVTFLQNKKYSIKFNDG